MTSVDISDMTNYIASSSCTYSVSSSTSIACGNKNVFTIEDAATACSCSSATCSIGIAFGK